MKTTVTQLNGAVLASALAALALALSLPGLASGQQAKAAAPKNVPVAKTAVSDAALVKSLPGFKNGYADVGGIRLHYVIGGKGQPLVLLPGWPETWWAFHKMMPALAEHYTVVSVDLRGMGASSKPTDGYDKKTMARDVYEMVKSLGYNKASVAGHDIGSAVAFSYGANFPQATNKIVMLDVPHPDESLLSFPLLPAHNTFGDKIDPAHPYPWWFAFHQVKGLPEKMLAGRIRVEQDWFFKYLLLDEASVNAHDRAVYEKAYNSADAIRAGNAWYQAFTQDVIDSKGYGKLSMPILAMGGPGYEWMKAVLGQKATDLTAVKVENSGHFVQEEQPEFVTRTMINFLK
jgi:pimeloyl-ACP methyl ester carboxylesterase